MGADENIVIKPKTNIADLFQGARDRKTYLKICAPMVRYSRLEFRHLVRHYGADLCFTPMTMADSFCQSFKARRSEFSTSSTDTPVIAQFAAKNSVEYLSAAEMIHPYVDGIDLNCGCPQSWAIETGYGCAMLRSPQLIHDLTRTVRNQLPAPFSVSVKIRVQQPLAASVDLCRQLESAGVTFLTVHGRTTYQKIKDPSDWEALRDLRSHLRVPMVANGDVKTLAGATELHERTGCEGVMSARGILANPALFAGHDRTPLECVQHWVDLCEAVGDQIMFQCYHHHLAFMMEKMMQRKVRVEFNDFTSKQQVAGFLWERFGVKAQPLAEEEAPRPGEWLEAEFDEGRFRERMREVREEEAEAERRRKRQAYSSEASEGKFFRSQKERDGGEDGVAEGEEEEDEEDSIDCSDLFAV